MWQDAIAYYAATCVVFRPFPFALRRVVDQQIGSSDSVHRNIAEGYCQRSIREYLNFLNIALGSMGESVSGLHACRMARQLDAATFERLDEMAYRLENGLLRLVESLEARRDGIVWDQSAAVRESNAAYGSAIAPSPHSPIPPFPQSIRRENCKYKDPKKKRKMAT